MAKGQTSSRANKQGNKPFTKSTAPRPAGLANLPHQSHGKSKQFTVKEPEELLAFLLKSITNLSRNSVKSLLSRGQIWVNDQVVTAYNFPLKPGQSVSVGEKKAAVSEAPRMNGVTIMYEDDDIIVIQKESGLLSIASETETEMTAYRQLMEHVRRDNPQNRIFVVHRLDRDTSGVMMFAKSQDVQQTLQNSWNETVKERTYIALVEGKVKKPEGTISSWLKESKTLLMYSNPYPNGGQHAVTHYKVLKSNPNFSLLEVNLETGRKNQIRVHMQDIGHPVVNDRKYGAKTKSISRLGLHARVLAFDHPTTGALMRFETAIPKMFLNAFKDSSPK
ncbi:RluA family pseudouridine synthase [Tumebacillus permanentifrigoris]|uniref:Pseudouridine synthase n=1 Tax=Tumebacillus permanentifrigoris TaxID=378543 RepID=A0A316D8V8_9BACL|nr:RluA family pseudouridine synthase [Tumebacillus permanentifrigoris]PWK13409.1 RluA family pseudouridine synthase [Tumebacillus permanentifrigoris]